MPALKLATPDTVVATPPRTDLSEAERALLNHLRLLAMRCRASRRTDLFEACAVLSSDKRVSRAVHAEILMRTLSQALDRAPLLYSPGVSEVSFDEAWILRVARSYAAGDDDSAQFLIRSRVVPHARRNVGFLIAAVSDEFCLI